MITNNKEKEKTITDKTDIVFKQMHKEILAIESKYKMMIDKIQFNEYLDAEQKKDAIKDLQQEKQLHIYQKKLTYTQDAIHKGYKITTQDISMLLDLEPNFCSRYIKEYIDFIRIPSDVSELFKSYANFNAIEQVDMSRKKLLFNEQSLYKLIKEYLFEVDKFIEIEIDNISELLEFDEDYYLCEVLANEFVDKIKEENEYKNAIADEQLEDIKNNKSILLRQDSLKDLVSQLLLRDKIRAIRRKINIDFKDNDNDAKKVQENILSDYVSRVEDMSNISSVLNDLSLIKLGNMTHQTQITRRAKKLQHTRYHLLLPGRKQPITLYGIANGDIKLTEIEDVEKDISKIKVVLSIHNIYENIDRDIYNYIETNIDKLRKNKDI